jgi:hypothetical protein
MLNVTKGLLLVFVARWRHAELVADSVPGGPEVGFFRKRRDSRLRLSSRAKLDGNVSVPTRAN